jgi:hypothetical protein
MSLQFHWHTEPQFLCDLGGVSTEHIQPLKMLLQMVRFAVRPNFAAKVGELLGHLSESFVELEILAFNCEYSAKIRAPSQYVNVPRSCDLADGGGDWST